MDNPSAEGSASAVSTNALTWGLAIATYNRANVLLQTVEYALKQTRPPIEIVICDSSADWQETMARVSELVDRMAPGMRVCYLHSSVAQQTVQRNIAIENAAADVLFMIDDDAFLRRDAAELAMRVYEASNGDEVVSLGLGSMPTWQGPDHLEDVPRVSDEVKGSFFYRLAVRAMGSWFSAYPHPVRHYRLPEIGLPLEPVSFIHGYRITVRRRVAKKCGFDESLVSNWFEDGDASQRFTEEGSVVMLQKPLIYHAASPRPTGQTRRGIFSRFGWIMNISYLNRKNFGGGLYVRLFCLTHWLRVFPVDVVDGFRRKDFSKLKGTLSATLPLLRLTLAPQRMVGEVLIRETHALQAKLERQRPG